MEPEDPRAAIERLCRERDEDFAGLSRLLGRNPSYVQQFVRRGSPRKLDEADRATLARYFDVPQSRFGGPAARTPPPTLRPVPVLDVGASAGPGAEPGGEDGAGAGIAFDERTLRMLAGGDPAALSMIRVAGDSMAPTLADGDSIMVDRGAATRPLRDGIHVVRIDGALVVKRLAATADGARIRVTSDNPAAPDPGERASGEVAVVGRVVWVGRRLD